MKTLLILVATMVVAVLSVAPLAHAQNYGDITSNLQNGTYTAHVNKQVQISADVTNGLNRDQQFAYIVQILDKNGVVVQLSWLTGTLTASQSLNPSQSWTPTSTGDYTAQIFVWSGINNPDALSAPLIMKISVT